MCLSHCAHVSRRQVLGLSMLGLAAMDARAATELLDVRTRFDGLPPKTVVLTLDACGGVLDTVLSQYLCAHGMACSVFATGLFAAKNPQAMRLFASEGWDVLNHGQLHHAPISSPGRLWNVPCTATQEGLRLEVEDGARQLEQWREHAPRVYRGATAMYDARTIEWLVRNDWTIGGYTTAADAGGRATSASVRRVREEVRSGDVLLAHINHPERQNGVHVVELLEYLRARGFSFVSWSQAQASGVRVQTVMPWAVHLDRA